MSFSLVHSNVKSINDDVLGRPCCWAGGAGGNGGKVHPAPTFIITKKTGLEGLEHFSMS